jgi:hypothetical protein
MQNFTDPVQLPTMPVPALNSSEISEMIGMNPQGM